MNYHILAGELQQPQYAEMDDAAAAAALNAVVERRQRVAISALQARAMETGIYVALRVAVQNPQAPPQLQAVCQTVLDLANASFADVDLDNPASVQMFGALQAAEVITAQQAAAIDALANVTQPSRAAALGLGAVTAEDVGAARAEVLRDAAFAQLRERLVTGYVAALAWLQQQQAAGADAPAWDDVLARL